jgi:ATP-dependent helicase/nuclease subunit B
LSAVAHALLEAADAGRTVLTPSVELQATLFDAVERAQRAAGREVWPTPRIRDFGGWVRELYVERQLADSGSPRCLSEVEERELWRRIVLEGDAGFLEPAGAARAARRARRAMHEYGISLAELAAVDSEEARALLAWADRFARRCAELDCVAPGELLASLERMPEPERAAGGIAWIESPLWRPVARRWLERHAGRPLEPASLGKGPALDTLEPGRRPPAPARFVRADSPAAELAALARWARGAIEADASFRAWVAIPDLASRRAQVADALDAELAPQRFAFTDRPDGAAYALAGGTPLAGHAPVRAALELLASSSGLVAFERFSRLLRAPELSATPAEAGAAARLDALLRSRVPSEATLAQWFAHAERVVRSRALEPPAALARLAQAMRALDQLRGSHPISRWLPVWIEAFELGPWSLRQRWSSAEFQAAERFRELLAALAVGDRLFGGQTRANAEEVLHRAARETAFQAQTGVPPIWVSGQPADPWLCYDGLWVTGCDEGRWPPPVNPIPLLPVALQRRYGVVGASIEAQLASAEDLQRRWRARAHDCVFSCADSGEGPEAKPSPLLVDGGAALAVESAPAPQPHWRLQFASRPAPERLADERAPRFGTEERTRGVATLRAQSRCAFRGFAETRLEADLLERPQPGFNERERGELLHEALHAIFSGIRDSARLRAVLGDEPTLRELLRSSAARALERLCQRRDPGARWRERESARLQGLLRKWLELESLRPDFIVEAAEDDAAKARHGGLDFTVRVDRIDRLADGGRVVIDYKTGTPFADWRGERPDNPQLPVYGLLHRDALVAVAYGRVNAAECLFVPESARGDIFPNKRASRLEDFGSFEELIAAWEQRIERIASAFARGDARVDPTDTACRTCRLHGLCRVPSALDTDMALDPRGDAV